MVNPEKALTKTDKQGRVVDLLPPKTVGVVKVRKVLDSRGFGIRAGVLKPHLAERTLMVLDTEARREELTKSLLEIVRLIEGDMLSTNSLDKCMARLARISGRVGVELGPLIQDLLKDENTAVAIEALIPRLSITAKISLGRIDVESDLAEVKDFATQLRRVLIRFGSMSRKISREATLSRDPIRRSSKWARDEDIRSSRGRGEIEGALRLLEGIEEADIDTGELARELVEQETGFYNKENPNNKRRIYVNASICYSLYFMAINQRSEEAENLLSELRILGVRLDKKISDYLAGDRLGEEGEEEDE